ncbi:MAG: hypothetical protein JJW00_03225 [Sulfurimonas sp.]|nr:hypothetical protein [Sulfurimonas sp.]
MKIVFICLLFISSIYADEVQRIESIVDDIAKIRVDYERCQSRLKSMQKTNPDIMQYKKLLAVKEKEIKALKESLAKKNIKVCKVPKDDNPFPKLIQKKTIKTSKFKANAFRLKKSTYIYSSPASKKIEIWEKNRSFTSYIGTKNWIKITGYFVDKRWRLAKKDMWIKRKDVKKRY